MANSFLKVRRGAAVLLLAAGVVTSACGGDDGGGGGGEPEKDSGTPPVIAKDAAIADATTPAPDAGAKDAQAPRPDSGPITTIGDAGDAELAAALDPNGVNVSPRRAQLVFEATCQRAKQCDDPEYTDTCVSDGIAAYQMGVDGNYSQACLDAALDAPACFATVANCDDYYGDGCSALAETAQTTCAPFRGDSGTP